MASQTSTSPSKPVQALMMMIHLQFFGMYRIEIIQLDVRAYLEIQPQFQYNKITRERVRLSCEYRNHECAESDQ